jgi:hypothetical protein
MTPQAPTVGTVRARRIVGIGCRISTGCERNGLGIRINECGVRNLQPYRPSPGRNVRDRRSPRTVPHHLWMYHGWERMSTDRVTHRHDDSYDLLPVAVALLRMSAAAEREARARRGAAEFSRRLGKLNGQADDFEAAATALETTSARVAACARRLRDMAERLTGLSAGRVHPPV